MSKRAHNKSKSSSCVVDNYSWAYKYIDHSSVTKILELGSRDGLDSLSLCQNLDADVLCFEPDPRNYLAVTKNIAQNPRIKALKFAVGNESGLVDFFSATEAFGNPGASSMFVLKDGDQNRLDIEKQRKIRVKSVRLDDLSLSADLIAMDIQGAELDALQGGVQTLQGVKYVIFEASLNGSYKNGATWRPIHLFLKNQGFEFLSTRAYGPLLQSPNLLMARMWLSELLSWRKGTRKTWSVEHDFIYRKSVN